MSDIETLQKEYEAAQQNAEKAKLKLKAANADRFKSLPKQVGLKTVDALIKELLPFASGVTKGKLKGVFDGKGIAAKATPAKATTRKPRAKLDDARRKKIEDRLREGQKTAAEVAEEFDVSKATVNDIKAKAKLTKRRK